MLSLPGHCTVHSQVLGTDVKRQTQTVPSAAATGKAVTHGRYSRWVAPEVWI